jgi:signal transduction histidine kinase
MTSATDPLRLLLVDDDASVREVLSGCLASPELEVRQAATVAAASDVCRDHPVDAVLLAERFAAADGGAALRQLRAAAVEAPVLVLTRGGEPARDAQLQAAGAFDCIPEVDQPGVLARSVTQSVRIHRLEQRLRAAEEAARGRDDLVSVVSHDLRNPLNTIAMGLTILERSPDLDAHQGVIARLRRGATRLDRIIADLLDVTRIDSGTLMVDQRPVAPSSLLEEVLELLGPQAHAKGQQLDVTSPPHAPMVMADRDRVMQVLLNLVGNAIKFTPDGGLVAVSAARHGDGVRFDVRDTGPGIPADDVPHVFDRFWQARSTARLGTGLGLYIAKGIIDAHGGKLQVESAEGLGTSIAFTLVAATEADRLESARQSSESLIAPRTALHAGRASA